MRTRTRTSGSAITIDITSKMGFVLIRHFFSEMRVKSFICLSNSGVDKFNGVKYGLPTIPDISDGSSNVVTLKSSVLSKIGIWITPIVGNKIFGYVNIF